MVWILIFKGLHLGKGAHNYLSTRNLKWSITEPLHVRDASSDPRKLDVKPDGYETYLTVFENQVCHAGVHWQSQLFTDEHLMVITSHCSVETRGSRGSVVMRNSWSRDSCDASLLSPLGVVSLGCGPASD